MNIENVVSGNIESLIPGLSESPAPRGQGFGEMLSQGINELNQIQSKAVEQTHRLAAGEDVELHDVMIASQEADVALRMATQLRTQVLEAYREVLRMPI
ncbi:MAG: flagellar hook-basal body complex protein FliE [Candidatus Melainabacteria bacterium HGW-Melainabacteria-1]|nr:MAG: flagellar hook-basal body complex protein FliE [Candidatus Melainabacteria bacterium HGW-Melainabacteria-1]